MTEAGHAEPVRPARVTNGTPPTAQDGPAAMWEEYPDYKAAGLLPVWRRKWRAFLPHEPQPEVVPSNG